MERSGPGCAGAERSRPERYWQQGLECSLRAEASGALVPLATERVREPALEPFQLRRLLSPTPRHLRTSGPRPNPFLPWERELEVARLGADHVLILNKYPVQPGHLLLITQGWQPQAGWLQPGDWRAVAAVAADTGGLWFFNSCAAAGASQPHRHLQLLPRLATEPSCPLAPALWEQLLQRRPAWPWCYRLSRRQDPGGGSDLAALYHQHALALGLGDPQHQPLPRHPYNLLFNDHWFLTVRRRQEHTAGFSINALGFAGYLLQTEHSDLGWLRRHGPWALLQQVACREEHQLD